MAYEQKIGYNKEWAKKVGKKAFVKHMNETNPGFDHDKAFDKIVPPKEVNKKAGE